MGRIRTSPVVIQGLQAGDQAIALIADEPQHAVRHDF
jgi:hypothetical protein